MTLHEQIRQYYPQYSDIQHYPADKCACVRKTKDEWGILGNFYRTYMNKAEYDGQEHDETSHALFEAQAIAIRKIAEQESCVLVGRCGFHIFADHPNALKIFIHSSEDCRKRRIAEKYGLGLSDAAAMVVDNDYSRELYTKTFTGKDWTDARNYDISIDVRKFGINGAVDFLMKCIE